MTGKQRGKRLAPPPAVPRAIGRFERVAPNRFAGTVRGVLGESCVVEILADGWSVAAVIARPTPTSDASEGPELLFVCDLDDARLLNVTQIEARLANVGTPVGQALRLGHDPDALKPSRGGGRLTWLGGVHFAGYLPRGVEDAACEAWVDGVCVIRVPPRGWALPDGGDDTSDARRAIDFHLPHAFADGRVRRVTVRLDDGGTLGPPLPFIAFPDGLARFISESTALDSERPRAEMFDRLLPMSVPFDAYEQWCHAHVADAPVSTMPILVVIIGEDHAAATIESLERQPHAQWSAMVVSNTTAPLTFDGRDILQGLSELGEVGPVVVTCVAGTTFKTGALDRIAVEFERHPATAMLYGDAERTDSDGRRWPVAFPAFDFERMLEQGYLAQTFASPAPAFRAAIDAGASDVFELALALAGGPPHAGIRHVPVALTVSNPINGPATAPLLGAASVKHLAKQGVRASASPAPSLVSPSVWIRYGDALPPVTIVIPTRNRADLLRTCLTSIAPAVRRAGAAVVIADNDSTDGDTLALFKEIAGPGLTVLRVPGHFNFARINNVATASVQSEALCLLNNDVAALDETWLDEMRSRLIAPKVGAVGVTLIRDNGLIQHAGVTLGPHFDADHTFAGRLHGDPGYTELLLCAHECSAVTAACLLTWTHLYREVGGMDERAFAVAYNDVDYGLKLRSRGYRIVLTPRAHLLHNESQSRGRDDGSVKARRFEVERDRFRARWAEVLMADPYYSPNLTLSGSPYSALSWPPRDTGSRVNTPPRAPDPPIDVT